MADGMDRRYLYQVAWQMACTESTHGYFASYHPDFPPELRLKWVRVERDDDLILDISKAVRQFDIEVEDLINNIKKGGNTNG
jgi:hypothetical protein